MTQWLTSSSCPLMPSIGQKCLAAPLKVRNSFRKGGDLSLYVKLFQWDKNNYFCLLSKDLSKQDYWHPVCESVEWDGSFTFHTEHNICDTPPPCPSVTGSRLIQGSAPHSTWKHCFPPFFLSSILGYLSDINSCKMGGYRERWTHCMKWESQNLTLDMLRLRGWC